MTTKTTAKKVGDMTEKELRHIIKDEVLQSLLNTLPKTVHAIGEMIKASSSSDNMVRHQ